MELQLLTIEEVSKTLKIKESTVRTWITRNKFPSECILKLGNCVRFRAKFLEEWLNNGNIQKVG